MKKVVLLMLSVIAAEEIFKIVKEDTEVKWTGRKITGSHFGTVEVEDGYLRFENGVLKGGEFKIDLDAIKVLDLVDPKDNIKLTNHLKSEDFFNVSKNRYSRFEITEVEDLGNGKFKVSGNAEIKGIVRPISFNAEIKRDADKVFGYTKIKFDRTEWDIKYGSGKFFKNLGDKLIYDDFDVEVNLVTQKSE